MSARERIVRAVLRAVDDVNEQLPWEQRLPASLEVAVLGEQSELDSLGLVNLIVAIEERVEEELGVAISIVDQFAGPNQALRSETLEGVADGILLLVEPKVNV